MVRKLIYVISFVLVLALASNAFAADPNVNVWTNATGNRLWVDPLNWDKGVVPGPGTHNTQINGISYAVPGPIINAGQVATTGDWDTWGPEWHIGLDIQGGSLLSGGAFVGLNIEGDAINSAYVNLGQGETGGSINITNFLVGDTWWWHGGGAGATYNQYSGTAIANDWIWLGGKMNLYGGYTKATNGFAMASAGQPNTMTTLSIYAAGGGGGGGKLSLPVGLYDDGTIAGWLAAGYLVPVGGTLGYDLVSETGRVVLYVPEPATIALLCLGGLALIRRKRS